MTVYSLVTNESATLINDGVLYQATSTHPEWAQIVKCLADKEYEEAADLFDVTRRVKRKLEALDPSGRLKIDDEGRLEFDGQQQGPRATEYLLDLADKGYNMHPAINFLTNLQDNPSMHSGEQALEFVVVNNMPIDEDGYFMAYKRITNEWLDCHSRSISNKVGEVVTMPRRKVDDDPSHTCSHGLHACSLEYLRSFCGDRLVAVRIDPKDVVAVPHDYNQTKMRVCKYEVMAELPIQLVTDQEHYWDSSVITVDGEDVDPEIPDGTNANGEVHKFVVVNNQDSVVAKGMEVTYDRWPSLAVFNVDDYNEAVENVDPSEGDELWLAIREQEVSPYTLATRML